MNFKDTRRKISVPLAMSINLQKKSSKPSKKNRKKKSWGDLGPRSAREKLSQMLVRSGEIPSLRQTSIDKTNDCAMKSERGALVRGADPPSGHSVHKTAGHMYVAGVAQASYTNTFGRCCVENRRQKISIPLLYKKFTILSNLRGGRRTPRRWQLLAP